MMGSQDTMGPSYQGGYMMPVAQAYHQQGQPWVGEQYQGQQWVQGQPWVGEQYQGQQWAGNPNNSEDPTWQGPQLSMMGQVPSTPGQPEINRMPVAPDPPTLPAHAAAHTAAAAPSPPSAWES